MAGERAFFSWCYCLTFVCFELLGTGLLCMVLWTLFMVLRLDFLYSALDFCMVFLDMIFSG